LYELVERGEIHLALSGILTGRPLESRALFPIRVLAVAARTSRWQRRTTIDVTELASEPVLLLSRDFGSRQLFDAACRIAQLQPHVVLESRAPHSLITLAEAGQAIAVVPSTVRVTSKKVRVMPVLQSGKSLGVWGGVAWDPRRSLPPYARSFIEELARWTARGVPGSRFDKIAPSLAPPPIAVRTD
jgi:DNA-binding transcriptional LysR family regulator